jgi:hypothetical protein
MNKLLPDGKRVLSEIVAGKGASINGMYILYGPTDMDTAPILSLEYIDNLIASGKGGYARVPITGSSIDADGNITFTALMTTADAVGGTINRSTKVRAAVLTWMPDALMSNDVFVYSTLMTAPVQFVKGAYMTINVKMSIGE